MIYDIPPYNENEITCGQDSYMGWANEDKEKPNITDHYCTQLAAKFHNKMFLRVSLHKASEIAQKYNLESYTVFRVYKSKIVWEDFLPDREQIEEQMNLLDIQKRPILLKHQLYQKNPYKNISQTSYTCGKISKNTQTKKIIDYESFNKISYSSDFQTLQNKSMFISPKKNIHKESNIISIENTKDINDNFSKSTPNLTSEQIRDLQFEVFGPLTPSFIKQENQFPDLSKLQLNPNGSKSLSNLSSPHVYHTKAQNNRLSVISFGRSFKELSVDNFLKRSVSSLKLPNVAKRHSRVSSIRNRLSSTFSFKRFRKNK